MAADDVSAAVVVAVVVDLVVAVAAVVVVVVVLVVAVVADAGDVVDGRSVATLPVDCRFVDSLVLVLTPLLNSVPLMNILRY